MDTPITINSFLTIFGIVVSVVAFMKAFDWIIEKFNKKHDQEQQIDENSESLEAYIKKNDEAIATLNKRVTDAHTYATTSLNTLEKNITDALNEQKTEFMKHLKADKDEYLEGIKRVEATILETQAVYQQTVAVVDVKIEALEKSQASNLSALTREVERHNNVISRTYELEKNVAVLDQRETASEKRIRELESDKKA